MSTACELIGLSPASNPDKMRLKVTFSGDYVNGTPDPLNLAPYDDGNNAGGFTNPNQLPVPSMPFGLEEAPAIGSQLIGGYYVEPDPLLPGAASNGVAPVLALNGGVGLRVYDPGGNELASGAYPAAMTNAGTGVIIEVNLPKDQ